LLIDETGTEFMPWCAQLPAGCLVALEASSTAHHGARKLIALGLDARIIAAHLVVPYRLQGKSGKNDANDAAAICEAASRPQMHCVSPSALLDCARSPGKRRRRSPGDIRCGGRPLHSTWARLCQVRRSTTLVTDHVDGVLCAAK
jgi:hypothetical protein